MRITYLTNRYPAVSHTFVRREILALEALGHTVERLTIRAAPDSLPDPADEAERARTTAILGAGRLRVLGAALGEAMRRPARTLAALGFALRLARRTRLPYPKLLAYLAEALIVTGICRRSGAELLRVHFGTNGAVVARLARRLGGPPYSVAVHGPDEFDAPERWDLGGTVAESAFTTAITRFCAGQIMRWSRTAHWRRIAVVRCAVGADFLALQPLPPDTEVRRLVTVARLAPQKGLPLLLDALAEARRHGAPLELAVVGDGPGRAALERQARRLGLGEAVRFHGALSGAGVRRAIEAAHAMVLPSFAEGLPVVLMEAFGLGRPAIATRIAGIPELVVDGENGWLVDSGNARALAEALEGFARLPLDELAAMGEAAHRAVRAAHRIEDQAAVLDHEIRRRLGG